MLLRSLTMNNFRQHVDTRIEFGTGLIGIIGVNGSGKSTILEAIAWALYGNSAARGTRDSIRHDRAPHNATVKVILEFDLGGHSYRVERSLKGAEVWVDNGNEPLSKTIRAVNEFLQRKLGMTRTEFFNTWFTGQKELDVMASLGAVERARFLSRVLGYDRLAAAQELLRDERRSINAERNGVKSSMQDAEQVDIAVVEARNGLDSAISDVSDFRDRLSAAQQYLDSIVPIWNQLVVNREKWSNLETEIKICSGKYDSSKQEVNRLEEEVKKADRARVELEPLLLKTQTAEILKRELVELDVLSDQEAERRDIQGRSVTIQDEISRVSDRLVQLEPAPEMEFAQKQKVEAIRETLSDSETLWENARTAWIRDKQEAETRLDALRIQCQDLRLNRDTLEKMGKDSPCPTCGRPLGSSFVSVLAQVDDQFETAQVDEKYFSQRVHQLSPEPDAVQKLKDRSVLLKQELASAEKRLARIQAGISEREQLLIQQRELQKKQNELKERAVRLSSGYDAEKHAKVRAEMVVMQDMLNRISKLQGMLENEVQLRESLVLAKKLVSSTQQRMEDLIGEHKKIGFDTGSYELYRVKHAEATEAVQEATIALVSAQATEDSARIKLDLSLKAKQKLEQLKDRLSFLDGERILHDELDSEYGEMREELNERLRPEISELASELLESLTDGRYSEFYLDEDYAMRVLEYGIPRTVLSGGEEDLCNLVLRLSISQMIAERSGQAFSLLILDEVFGSLDEARRENVMTLLRRLQGRFEQVILITHIEDVRQGLDRVLRVTYDASSGQSHVNSVEQSLAAGIH